MAMSVECVLKAPPLILIPSMHLKLHLCVLQAPEDRLYLARVLEVIADRGSISTPGAPFSRVSDRYFSRVMVCVQSSHQALLKPLLAHLCFSACICSLQSLHVQL